MRLNEMTETIVKQVEKKREETKSRRKRQPRYSVILWDDNDHTYDYVIRMVQELFGYDEVGAFEIGLAVCLTTTMEHAELKRDQIHAYGSDSLLKRCQGSMSATIEPVE